MCNEPLMPMHILREVSALSVLLQWAIPEPPSVRQMTGMALTLYFLIVLPWGAGALAIHKEHEEICSVFCHAFRMALGLGSRFGRVYL